MEGQQSPPGARAPAPHPPRTRASLLAALTEAVHDRDEHVLRRLLARFAEQATLTDLPALRHALDPQHHQHDRPPAPR
ncbi:hypothetical protein GCM10010495_65670 [Kitasatospora herbaricolor]|uniref:hypothetical protein n=1 Tax=Kitasatospora herbaricolor TaxID=68217 RepID=UPI00174C591B|nr:hypothetical protein [Kitasatospora herbaricolor]MDQ0313406.1 hypothetical protein [Kitasatospora herbaricolor]GGV39197.1 hypothetical protein GCM10010495_65670 [Kitasatospora herbaricolor]